MPAVIRVVDGHTRIVIGGGAIEAAFLAQQAASAAVGDIDANKAQASAIGIGGTDTDMGAFTSPLLPDNATAKAVLEALAGETEVLAGDLAGKADVTALASTSPGDGASMVALEQGGTVQDAVSWVTPQMFGAVADDSSLAQARLNRAAINAAIAYLYGLGGGVVRIPHGVYHVAQEAVPVVFTDGYIQLRGGVAIDGDGMDSTRIIRSSTNSILSNSPAAGDDYTANGSNIRVSNLTLDGNPAVQATPANLVFLAYGSDVTFDSVRFLNVPGLHAIDANSMKGVNVTRCRFEGHDHALTVAYGGPTYYPESFQISSTFTSVGASLPCETIRVRDSYFGPSNTLAAPICSIGNHTISTGHNASDVIVDGCVMDGMTRFGIRPFCWQGGTISNNRFLGCVGWAIYVSSANNSFDSEGDPTGIPVSNAGILIENNEIIDAGDIPITFSPGGGDNVTAYARVQKATVRNNRIVDTTPQPNTGLIFAAWVDSLVVEGNTHTGHRRRALEMRFCTNVTLGDNNFGTYEIDCVTINESGSANENTWAGTGLTSRISIFGNKIFGSGFYGINIHGNIREVSITGNFLKGIGNPNPRPAIVFQSGITRATIFGNILDGSNGGMTIGVDVRSGATDIIVGRNTVIGATSAPYSHAGTGVVNAGGAGTPQAAIIAPVGSTWTRSDGGTGTTLYVKETGTSSTGWVAK